MDTQHQEQAWSMDGGMKRIEGIKGVTRDTRIGILGSGDERGAGDKGIEGIVSGGLLLGSVIYAIYALFVYTCSHAAVN